MANDLFLSKIHKLTKFHYKNSKEYKNSRQFIFLKIKKKFREYSFYSNKLV